MKAREVFERAVEFYGEDNLEADLFVGFARFEERQKEVIDYVDIDVIGHLRISHLFVKFNFGRIHKNIRISAKTRFVRNISN